MLKICGFNGMPFELGIGTLTAVGALGLHVIRRLYGSLSGLEILQPEHP
jgi:hypothetical protein